MPAGAARREHDACGRLPMVLRGRGRIARRMQDGRELVLFDLGPGESCVPSTSCLLGDARYKAHAASETEAELAVMPRALFDRLVAEHPPFRSAVFSPFGERLVRRVELAAAVGFQRIEQRLAGALLGCGRELRTSREKRAQRLGGARETVSRMLESFENQRWVRLQRGATRITRPQALGALAGAMRSCVTGITEGSGQLDYLIRAGPILARPIEEVL